MKMVNQKKIHVGHDVKCIKLVQTQNSKASSTIKPTDWVCNVLDNKEIWLQRKLKIYKDSFI